MCSNVLVLIALDTFCVCFADTCLRKADTALSN